MGRPRRHSHKAVLHAIGVHIEPETEEMIVVDRHRVLRNHVAVSRVTAVLIVGHGATGDGLDLFDAAGADGDLDRAVLAEHPIENVVVVADCGDQTQHEVGPLATFTLAVD